MSQIPTQLTQEQSERYTEPYLSKAERGSVAEIPLPKIFNYILHCLYTGCQRKMLPAEKDPENPDRPEISRYSVYYRFRKWCKNGSFGNVRDNSVGSIRDMPNLTCIYSDGTRTRRKRRRSSCLSGTQKSKDM